jgi:xanthine dehydrogenase YagR molybdenum-binding subunit
VRRSSIRRVFAFESCVDELAYKLNQDPVALRLANDATVDAVTKRPLSSRHVAECLTRGAERFGWAKRTMTPQSMRADDGSFVGWGVCHRCLSRHHRADDCAA